MKQNDQKCLLLLGGSRYLIPVIEIAHELGCYVITCDYLPDNYAHQLADEYCNISIIDKEAVLAFARERHIDGILSFACDPGVVTGAYVAEQLGLPYGGSYEACSILQDKGRFRAFLRDNGFQVPKSCSYTSAEDACADSGSFTFPVIVKPVDSAGSKGVTRVDTADALKKAADHAMDFSICGSIIIEEYIAQQGFASDTDCFSLDGELVYASFNNQYFDSDAVNPYVPAGFSWPSFLPQEVQQELRSELQRLIHLLDLKTTVYNIECRLGQDGKAYLMEVSPRGGGNCLCEMLRHATGTDLIRCAVRAAIGEPLDQPLADPVYNGHWAQVILHSNQSGTFRELWIDEAIRENVVKTSLWIQPGDRIDSFGSANKSLGTLVLQFDTTEKLETTMNDVHRWVKIICE